MRRRPDETATRAIQRELLEDLTGRRPRSDAQRAGAFRRPPRGSVASRWHVYAHGYLARIEEAMGLEYAAIRRILGPGAFSDLVERYVGVFPSRTWDLARVGERLPGFLELDRLSIELPFLPDLATLEQAVSRAFVAADAEPLAWTGLATREPEEVASLRLALLPGVAVVRSVWPLHALWTCRLEEDDAAVSIRVEGNASPVLVHRRGGRVRVEPVGELESALVEAASCGDATLAELQELAGAEDPDALVAAFRALVEREVFVLSRSAGWTGALELSMEVDS